MSTISNEVYKILKKRIINFEIMPKQILMVQQLANELNMSRTPVREALVRLKGEGFIVDAEGKKFQVKEITWKMITEIYEIRKLFESVALNSICGNINKSKLKPYIKYTDNMEKAYLEKRFEDFFENDYAFHLHTLQLFDNTLMSEWMIRMQGHQQRIRYLTSRIDSRLKESVLEHRNMVDFLKDGNSEGAVSSLKSHLDSAVNDMEKFHNNIPISPIILKS